MKELDLVVQLEQKVWGSRAATKEMIASRIDTFPEGNFLAMVGGVAIGVVFTQLITPEAIGEKSWYEYTDGGLIRKTHNPKGSILFGVGLSVLENFSGKGVGTRLLIKVGEMAIKLNLKKGILGGRIPFFSKFNNIPAEEYIRMKDENGKLVDPELRFYKRAGLKVMKLIPEYFDDPKSRNFGVLLEWENMFFPVKSHLLRWIDAKIFSIGFRINLLLSK